ncbi:MAG: M23 family metallopeptidase [Bacteroidetes bacterium]|nr:M23 family metallopeptidase [Rhodothermia bacterium]MCS7155797.1 M23 family metallopeptidase [Bacteroidota bacterium]MCX7906102.1 M23 family metallopeptidase [Bacteroidota bacterium]MDW8138230.1 M23 family metallopeptidase [Bacteroidota bacterium]MDW8285914.1 M23 family metallopeptidase [Bacteroidota bacterium]
MALRWCFLCMGCLISGWIAQGTYANPSEELALQRPVNAPVWRGFGLHFHPLLRKTQMNLGVSFVVQTRTPVYAAAEGRVREINRNLSRGLYVIIEHGRGYETVYAHLSRVLVERGQRVELGAIIGYVGEGERASTTHVLRFELHRRGNAINPEPYFRKG